MEADGIGGGRLDYNVKRMYGMAWHAQKYALPLCYLLTYFLPTKNRLKVPLFSFFPSEEN